MLLIFHLLEREYSPVISSSMVLQGLCRSKIKKTLATFGFIPNCSVITFPLLFDEKRQAKKDEETKGYGDYNWEELYKSET